MTEKYGIGIPVHESNEAMMDIVFVHGLFGDRVETWTHKGASEDQRIFWPKDLLAKDMENTRILSFGYDSDIVRFSSQPSQNTIKDHANNLVGAIAGQRTGEKLAKRPPILIAHSLGGLVCAEAILSADRSTSDDWLNIGKSTKGIIFLGTPFHGAKQATLGEITRRIVSVMCNTNRKIVKDLQPDSAALSELVDRFAQRLTPHTSEARLETEPRIECVCFFEELKTQALSEQIVPKESAHISGHEMQSIRADHVNMCKFKSSDDDGYDKVHRVLERWATKLSNSQKLQEREIGPHNNIGRVNFTGDDNQGSIFGQATGGSGNNYFGKGS